MARSFKIYLTLLSDAKVFLQKSGIQLLAKRSAKYERCARIALAIIPFLLALRRSEERAGGRLEHLGAG